MINTFSMRCNGATGFLERMVPLCAQHYKCTQILYPKHINKEQGRWMLAGKIPRVCICLFACVPKLLVPVSLKAKFSCIHPLQKWLVTTACALDPERTMNCMCYSLFYIHRKWCYLYWYTVMTYQLPHTKDYVSWFQSNLLGWEELSLHNGLMIYVWEAGELLTCSVYFLNKDSLA